MMYPTPEIALDALTAVYQEMHGEAKRYAQRPDENATVTERLDNRLQRFNRAVRTLQAVGYAALWAEIDHQINDLRRVDPSLDGITINLLFQPNVTRTGLLTYPLYAAD